MPSTDISPAGPIEAEAREAFEAEVLGPIRQVYIVSSRYGPEGIYSTPDRANAKVNELMRFAAYNATNPDLRVRPYTLDSE